MTPIMDQAAAHVSRLRERIALVGDAVPVEVGRWRRHFPGTAVGAVGRGIAVVVVIIARSARGSGQAAQSAETPLAILKRRYAQGEISSEQFEAAKRQLGEPEQRKES